MSGLPSRKLAGLGANKPMHHDASLGFSISCSTYEGMSTKSSVYADLRADSIVALLPFFRAVLSLLLQMHGAKPLIVFLARNRCPHSVPQIAPASHIRSRAVEILLLMRRYRGHQDLGPSLDLDRLRGHLEYPRQDVDSDSRGI